MQNRDKSDCGSGDSRFEPSLQPFFYNLKF